jgi:hypothetical protein
MAADADNVAMAADADNVSSEEMEKLEKLVMEKLVKQFSELGARIAFQMCMNFVEEIKINYPNVPKDEFARLALVTFKKNDMQVDAKVPASRSKLKEEDKCAKILPTGKNKGKKCSLPKTEGSEYCKRHRNKILTSSNKGAPLYQKQISTYLGMLQPKGHEIKKPVPLDLRQYKNENMYLDEKTNIMFRLDENKEYIAFGVYVEGQGVARLSENEIIVCDRNSWKYEE